MSDQAFKILSIDGGGVRGVFAAQILQLIEDKCGIDLNKTFDLIVGTSTGSIIASAIATEYSLKDLVSDYEKFSRHIFRKKYPSLCGLFCSKYSPNYLEQFIQERFGNVLLGEISRPLILNATNASVGEVYVFKSSYQEKQRKGDYVRDRDTPLYKAILASCSAPLYFPPVNIGGTLVCDGGIWANNPALVGYVDAIRNFRQERENIKIFSVGTGQSRSIYRDKWSWGFLTGWKRTALVDFVMSCQTKFPQNSLMLMNPNGIFRINPIIDNCDLDKWRTIPTLIELAKSEFTQKNTQIRKFIETSH